MTTTQNAGTVMSEEFKAKCEKHGINPTRRQWSKWCNGYGALALAEGCSRRAAPPGPNSHRTSPGYHGPK